MPGVWLELAIAALLAQQPALPPEPPNTVEGVTVTAPRTSALPTLLDELAPPAVGGRFEGQIARWNKPVCPGALGASPRVEAYLVRRIGEAARTAGARVARAPCRPNLIVAVTNESDRLVEQLVRKHRFRMFGRGRKEELAAFARSGRPVRWWHLSEMGPGDGNTASAGVPVAGGSEAPFIRLKPTRLRPSTRRNITAVLVVVDAAQTAGMPADALSAYVGMVGLAQVSQEPEVGGADTILTLFADRDAGRRGPEALTAFDRAYLTSLYAGEPDLRYQAQRRELEKRITRELQGAAASEAGG